MAFNSQEIIQDIRAEFEHLLDFVTGEQARALKNLRNKKAPKPFKVPAPIVMTVEFEQSDMADRAALLPHAKRAMQRRVEYAADDMVTVYLAFRAMLALAR